MDTSYFTDMLEAYTAKRKLMCETLERIGFAVTWPQGSYYVLANFEPLSKKRSGFDNDSEASRTLVNEAGVGTVAGKSFFQNPEDGRYYLRFCYAKEMPVLEQACKQLIEAFG